MLYLHIGLHKTGSSAIQHFCFQHQGELASAELHYSQVGLRQDSGQHDFAFCFRQPPHPPSVQQVGMHVFMPELVNELRTHANVLISSEVFSKQTDWKKLSGLRNVLSKISDITIILYLRNVRGFAEACYGQRIKSGITKQSSEEFDWDSLANLDYRETIQQWQGLFGEDKVVVRSYDRAVERDGTVIPDFLETVGLPTHLAEKHHRQHINITPHRDILEYILLWNKIQWQPQLPAMLHAYSELHAKKVSTQAFSILPDQLRSLGRQNAPSIRWVEDNFGVDDGPFFTANAEIPNQYPGLTDDMVDSINTYLFYGHTQPFNALELKLRELGDLMLGSAADRMMKSFARIVHRQEDRSEPFFTVLIPAYNRADVLHYAIKSALQQSFSDFELLVVGDGCLDHTEQVVKGFDDDRILWIDMPKAPRYGHENRNVALRAARGKYVAMLAHDDLWLTDHLEIFHREIVARDEPDIVISRPCWVDPKGAIFPTNYNLNNPSVWINFSKGKANGIPATNVVYKWSLHAKVGWWDGEAVRPPDHDLWVRILAPTDATHHFINKLTCLHFRANWRTDQNSEPGDIAKYRTLFAMQESIPSLFLPKDMPEVDSEQAYFYNKYITNQEFFYQLNSGMLDLYDQVVLNYLHTLASLDANTHRIDITNLCRRQERAPAHLDKINGRSSEGFRLDPSESMIQLEGWGFDPINQSVGSTMVVQVNETFYRVDQYGILRNDVANHFDLPSVRHAGFSTRVALDLAQTKLYTIRLWVIAHNQRDIFPTAVAVVFESSDLTERME